MERKWLEEKTARESLEAKVKSLKRKVKELKGDQEASVAEKGKETNDKQSDTADPRKPQSRSSSLDDVGCSPQQPEGDLSSAPSTSATVNEPIVPKKPAVVQHSASFESKESISTADTKQTSHQRSSESAAQTTNPKTTVHQKETLAAVVPSETIRRSSSGDVLNDSKSAQSVKNVNDIPRPAAQVPTETLPGGINEKLSPPRRRSSKDAVAEKLAAGISPLTKAPLQSQTVPTIDGPGGHAGGLNPVASSSDSLGSATDFDPLRSGHVNVHGDGTMSTASDPVAQGHHSTLSAGSSVASFITAPLPAQSIEFDPLSTNHQVPGSTTVQGLRAVSTEVHPPPPPQHGYSQSMPNFVISPGNIMMPFPVQQVDVSMMHQQGWQQNQQAVPIQNQYLPTQYTGTNAMAMGPQQYQVTQPTVQQQQQQQFANTNGAATDPFAELASRRAPGPSGGK